jgi:hypothetical protein
MITVTLAVVCYSTSASSYDDRVVLVSLGVVAGDPAPPPPPPTPPPPPPPPPRDGPYRDTSAAAGSAARILDIAMEWEDEDKAPHLHAEIQVTSSMPLLLEASELNTLLEESDAEEAEEADAAAAAASSFAALPSADVDVARRVVARWRALVAERKASPLLDLHQRHPDLFAEEVLQRLDPTALTMLAQVGRPWLAAVLASGLPRLPKGVRVKLRLREFCTSPERLAWAKANGCPWGECPYLTWSNNPCALAAEGGHLEALQWARKHHCVWDGWTCYYAAQGGHLAVLQWARAQGCPWYVEECEAPSMNHPDTLTWQGGAG